MTVYKYYNGEISNENENVGWIGEDISNSFNCLIAIKTILESHGHNLYVRSFQSGFEIIPVEPYVRETEGGIHISGRNDDLNYAYFSNEMNCNKLCANAVLKLVSA